MSVHERNETPSNRRFGFFFAFVLIAVAIYSYANGSEKMALIFSVISGVFLVAAIFFDRYLAPLNYLWMKLGVLLGRLVNPLVIGAIFFLVLTPVGLLMRFAGRDELRLLPQQRETHWRTREKPERDQTSFKNQF